MLTRRLPDAGLSAALAGAGFFSASSFFAAFLTAGFSALAEPTDSIWTRVSCWRWPRSFLVVLALLELEDQLLLTLELLEDDGGDLRCGRFRGVGFHLGAVDDADGFSSTLSPTAASKLLDVPACRRVRPCTACRPFYNCVHECLLDMNKRKAIAYQRDRSKVNVILCTIRAYHRLSSYAVPPQSTTFI